MLERTIEKGGIFGGDRNIIGGKCEIEKRREKGRERNRRRDKKGWRHHSRKRVGENSLGEIREILSTRCC